ncbi:MAG: tetratricopeptide repeat protein [bacterium]
MRTAIVLFAITCLLAFNLTGCRSTYVTSARVYLQEGLNDKAEEQLVLGLQQNPNDAEAHYLLGELSAQKKDYEKMLSEFRASLAISPKFQSSITQIKEKHFQSHFNNAVEHFNNQRVDQAIEALKIVTMINPDRLDGWSLLGKSYIRNKAYDEATAALTKAMSLDINFENTEDRVLLMEIYYNQGKFEEALNGSMEILRIEPTNKDAIRIAAFCYNQLDQSEKAVEYYQQVMADQPDDPDLVFNLGLLYEKMELYDNALAQFERTSELNPTDKEAILHCAQIYLEKKEDNLKAIEYYRRALELDPNNPGVMNNLGIALIRTGTDLDNPALTEEGKQYVEKALELRGEE